MKHAKKVFAICCFLGMGSMISQETMKKDDVQKDIEPSTMEMSSDENEIGYTDISDWPMASQKAVDATTKSYGEPSSSSADELVWRNAGIWEIIRISKNETKHSFPIEHTDMLEMTIFYDVPEEKMSDLGKFDGSVTFDRTQGFMSARCDLEVNNFLALNLAHDIITDKKTVEEARKAYADIIKEKMTGKNPDYMAKLQFEAATNAAADPDVNTTGLTKEEVMAAIKKNSKK